MCLLLAPVLWGWSWRTVLSGPDQKYSVLWCVESAEVGNEVECTATSVVGLSSVVYKVAGRVVRLQHFYFLISALAHWIVALNICWAFCRLGLGTEGGAPVIPEYMQPEFWLVWWGRETCNKCWGGRAISLKRGRKTLHYFWSPATDSACVWMWRASWDAEFSFLGMFRATLWSMEPSRNIGP